MQHDLSDYEKIREKNLAERAILFQKLNLDEASKRLSDSVKRVRQKSSNESSHESRKLKRRPAEEGESEEIPLRRSTRLMNRPKQSTNEESGDSSFFEPEQPVVLSHVKAERVDKNLRPRIYKPVRKSLEDVDIADAVHAFYNEIKCVTRETSSFERWLDGSSDKIVEQLKRAEFVGKVKVTKGRGSSMCFHPSLNLVAVIIGDKYGNVGFAKFSPDSFDPELCKTWQINLHDSFVSCVGVHEFQPNILCSTSYDGDIYRLDFESCEYTNIMQFPDLYDDNASCRNFNFVSPDVLIVCLRQPPVLLVDCRDKDRSRKLSVSDERLRSVNLHPVRRDYFITASSSGSVKIWDIRNVKTFVKDFSEDHSVHGAYFSPTSGDRIVTTSLNDELNLWTNTVCEDFEYTKKSVHHDNHVGRWLTNFVPIFHPKCEDLIICGSMNRNRRVEVFDEKLRTVYRFVGLTTVCSLNQFHSEFNLTCGVNSSGYLHVWAPVNKNT